MAQPIQVSDAQHARLLELKEIRRKALDRQVTISEIIGVLFENYDRVVAEQDKEDEQ